MSILTSIREDIKKALDDSDTTVLLLMTKWAERELFNMKDGINKGSSVEEEFADVQVIVTDELNDYNTSLKRNYSIFKQVK
jgi:hypothetical protein